ncbi:MAG: leucine-rich repeat domain-containing protein [Clostridiales bacterium]|nr:leucine-rich repeat domain-containing protein [Clostridiales bacterium]
MKFKRCLTASVFIMLLFSVSCFGYVLPDLSDFGAVTEDNDENVGIALTELSALSDIIEVKTLYRNDEGCVKALVFEETESIDGLELQINGISHTVTASPNSSGLVCEYFDEDIEIGNTAELTFIYGSDSYTLAADPADIVTTDEEWELKGNTLIAYNGDGGDITVPNFYDNTVVLSLGGNIAYDEDGNAVSYINILNGDTETEITSAEISEGILNIYPYAFYNMEAFEEVYLPESLEKIYAGGFACSGITSIDFPDGLNTIDSYAFYQCSALSGDITIPSGATAIGCAAFYNCPNLKGTLTLSEGVEEIGDLAFGSSGTVKEDFTALVLPDSLKKIGPYAFQYCTSITTISLPEGLETISDGAFDHMTGLTDTVMTIPSTVATIGGDYNVDENTGYGGHVFYDVGKNESFTEFTVTEGNEYFTAEDGVLYTADMTRMVGYPRGKTDTSFEIPEGITLIDELAFSRAAYLETVILPDSYEITTEIPENILNEDNGNSLAIALYLYTAVKDVEVKDTNSNYRSENGIVYSEDMKTLWYVPSAYDEDIVISEGCEIMESGSLYTKNSNKVNITIPSSVYEIDDNALDVLNEYFAGLITLEESIYYELDSEEKIAEISYIAGDVNTDGEINAARCRLDFEIFFGYFFGR